MPEEARHNRLESYAATQQENKPENKPNKGTINKKTCHQSLELLTTQHLSLSSVTVYIPS